MSAGPLPQSRTVSLYISVTDAALRARNSKRLQKEPPGAGTPSPKRVCPGVSEASLKQTLGLLWDYFETLSALFQDWGPAPGNSSRTLFGVPSPKGTGDFVKLCVKRFIGCPDLTFAN